jgi:two-component system sensor histidine kinase HydH
LSQKVLMRILPIKKMYLPALSIVAVVLLMLILISISTYRNLDREKSVALHFLYREGVALIRSIEAGARTGMKSLMWQEISLGSLLQETAKDKDIAFVYIVDGHGRIVHASVPSKQGSTVAWNPKIKAADQVVTRIVGRGDEHQIYELAKLFAPMYEPSMTLHQSRRMLFERPRPPHSHTGDLIILGMKMESLAQARQADIQHAFIMAAIILVLGSGALFFIFVIQNYYLVDKTLKQTKDYTRQVIASMANGLLSIDTEGRIASYNRPALDLLDLEESEAKGKELSSVIDLTDSGIHSTISEFAAVLDREIQYRKKSGEVIPLALSATPICNEAGACQGAVIVLRDLSEIKKLQEKVRRSEKLAAIGELAAAIAHEIRNPLSSIRGFAQFLRHALKDKPQEQLYAETMVSEVDRINRVVTDLLTFARPMEAELAPTDITELIEHTVRLVKAEAGSRNVQIETRIADVSLLPLDANQMTQALLNLILNALQAVDQEGRVEIGAEVNTDEACLHIWVADNGSGITPEQKEKIFEPFFTTREKGTGLGLAIVHKIVENHQGEIKVESPPPGSMKGCRFTMIIPTGIARQPQRGP